MATRRQKIPEDLAQADAEEPPEIAAHGFVGLAGNAGRVGEADGDDVMTFRAVQADRSSWASRLVKVTVPPWASTERERSSDFGWMGMGT